MTAEEAIEYAKNLNFCAGCNADINSDPNCDACEHKGFFSLAIEALQKQIPMERVCYEDKFIHCPSCRHGLGYKWQKYPVLLNKELMGLAFCPYCGQRLKWEDMK